MFVYVNNRHNVMVLYWPLVFHLKLIFLSFFFLPPHLWLIALIILPHLAVKWPLGLYCVALLSG